MSNEIKTKKKVLEELFESAIKNGSKFIAVKIQMEGFPKPEVIINQTENFEKKLEYYKKAYNEKLELNTFNGIKIIAFCQGESFDEIGFEITEFNENL